jgi:hypothetical protein
VVSQWHFSVSTIQQDADNRLSPIHQFPLNFRSLLRRDGVLLRVNVICRDTICTALIVDIGSHRDAALRRLRPDDLRSEHAPNQEAAGSQGGKRVRAVAAILLHVRGGDEPIALQRPARIVVGRLEAASAGEEPDLDLTPFGAPDKGVSRRHALIDTLEATPTLVDMGSSNGTFVNGQKLTPNQPCALHDGDEIRLGKLVARIYVK